MKRLKLKVGEYQKDGQTKGQYIDLGVIMTGSNGEYALLDPSVNLAGVLLKQNALSGQNRDSVMCSIFDSDQSNRQSQQQSNQSNHQNQNDNFSGDVPF